MKIYKGYIIHKSDYNSSGMRWESFGNNGRLRADTLTGLKDLINLELKTALCAMEQRDF